MKIKVGLIGFGRMGQMYWEEMQKSGRWDIAYICDTDPASRELARNLSPSSRIISDEQEIFDDQSVEAVGLFALANSRKEQIEKAVRSNKHILTEKPIADTIDKEWEIVDLIEKYDRIAAVNLYLRNSWYHQAMKQFIDEGEIGELAILRICHMTPGLAPGEGHEYEGPAYHDCGMHYIDIARWYADSEYKTWHAQGMRMWDYKDPWWVQCHGTFENGIAFDVTQGFVYGQLSRNQTHNAYTDIIGTKGIVRMTHDFRTAVVELHGVNRTLRLETVWRKEPGQALQHYGRLHRERETRSEIAADARLGHCFPIRMDLPGGCAPPRPARHRRLADAGGNQGAPEAYEGRLRTAPSEEDGSLMPIVIRSVLKLNYINRF